jgi:hypothetical protein
MDPTNFTPAQRMLADAISVIGQRRQTYGPPAEHWSMTVALVNAAFGSRLKTPLTISDWGLIMLLDKVARWQGPQRTADGPIDMAGYAACLAEVEGYGRDMDVEEELRKFAAQCSRVV